MALISLGGIVVSESLRVGGYDLDEAIADHVRRQYRLAIGQQTAEDVKLAVGSAVPLREELETEIRGRDVVAGLPKSVTLTSQEVRAALEEPLQAIVDAVKQLLERTPPELASDIAERGMQLAGGGSLLRGFDERLWKETGMSAYLVDSPLTCVAEGAGPVAGGVRAPRARKQASGPVASRAGDGGVAPPGGGDSSLLSIYPIGYHDPMDVMRHCGKPGGAPASPKPRWPSGPAPLRPRCPRTSAGESIRP